MATHKQGVLGGFSGKVGPVIGSSWKGKAVIKARALSYNDANTETQQQIRTKFKMLIQFASANYGFIDIGFKKQATDITQANAFIRQNFDDGITGTWPSFELNYPKIVLSKGNVDNPYNPAAQVQGSDINITWTDNSGIGNARDSDKVMFLVYNTAKKQTIVDSEAADRSTRQASYSLPSSWTGDTIEVYFAMQRVASGETSNSIFLGTFTL